MRGKAANGQRKHWKEKDIARLRIEYGVTPTRELAVAFGVSMGSVYQQAERQGLRHQLHARRTVWTEDKDNLVRYHYDGSGKSAEWLAFRLGSTIHSVKNRASMLGCSKRRDWTEKELEQLEEWVGTLQAAEIARRLRRTEVAVRVQAKRLGLKHLMRSGWYVASDVASILGVDNSAVNRWIANESLRATPAHGDRPGQQGGKMWRIEEKDLVEFIRRYPYQLRGRNIDLPAIVDLLAGILYT